MSIPLLLVCSRLPPPFESYNKLLGNPKLFSLLALTSPYSPLFNHIPHNRFDRSQQLRAERREESAGEQRSCEGLDDG